MKLPHLLQEAEERVEGLLPHQHADHATQKPSREGAPSAASQYKLEIFVNDGVYLDGLVPLGKVGHAWVGLEGPQGFIGSWGYWPQQKVNIRNFWKSVPATIRTPDQTYTPTTKHTYEINEGAAAKVEQAVKAAESAPGNYNLLEHNCIHFTRALASHAGVSLPGSVDVLGIANPSSLAHSLKAINRSEGEDAMERPLPKAGGGGDERRG